MNRSIPESFYKSRRWEKVRDTYLSAHPYCERCAAAGIIKPAVIVHHRQHLSMNNYHDPSIAYGWDNLEALCIDCHNREHFGAVEVRDGLYFDENGNLREYDRGDGEKFSGIQEERRKIKSVTKSEEN